MSQSERDLYKELRKLQRQNAKLKFIQALKPGVILYDSWGYEQTNVDFYKVLSIKGNKVTIQEIGHKQDGESTGSMSCYVLPDETSLIGEPLIKIVASDRININQSVSLRLWDGSRKYKSWYY